MLSVIKLLWKSSLNPKCRQVLEKNTVVSQLLELLSYEFDELVISYAVAILSELWKAEHLRFQLRDSAIPKYLELLKTSLHSQILARVCTALGKASSDSDSMKMINEVNGFRLFFVILPSLGLDEFDKYDDFYDPETIVAAAKCLTEMIINTPVNNTIITRSVLSIYLGGRGLKTAYTWLWVTLSLTSPFNSMNFYYFWNNRTHHIQCS